ncbi:MAG: GAF domain-containing sensor histidine kinase [Anaerolineae bacterium]|nr:GAF domain-containing sensor histidine kinase [Anaerolineae bacterium]MCB9108825.1 GAF domain-containing sensor histidine kinase [Anaerolineales bacterium]
MPMKAQIPPNDTTDKLQRRNRELFILHQIAEALNREVNLDEALQTALAQVAELFGLNTGWIFLYDSDNRQPYLAAAQNLPPALAEDSCLLMEGTCYCLDSHAGGGLSRKERLNVITCSRLKYLMDGTNGLRYHASIPLEAQHRPLGLLNVASAESNWWRSSNESLHLLHTVGDLLSIAIERAYLFGQSTQLGVIEERNRLAREIHDTLAQSLTGIALRLETIDAMLEAGADPNQVRDAVQQGLRLTQSTLEEARRSVLDLRAAPLAGRNLVEALMLLISEYERQSDQPQITLNVVGGNRPLPVRLEMGLYRIAQEGLNNIAQHAGAAQVEIELAITPEQVRLTIEDDGRGFDPTDVPTGHFGLIGLNERIKLLGGRLILESSPGAGVRIEVTIPLQEQERDR